jgi:predicted DsbA family dithiol-disulfide isomerase
LAYEAAVRLDPEVFAKVQADHKAKTEAEQQIAQARQAAVQVSGAPTAVAAPELNPKDRREFLRNQFSAQR